ncbi:MAG: hypothetical protein J6A85_00380 [Clostridia bacterium]|nr:hypothetical protein [Clostridia bacterium]
MKKIFALVFIITILMLVSCDSKEMRNYYSDKDNYVVATGEVTHIKYNDDRTALYIGLSRVEGPAYNDTYKFVGKNLTIVRENGIDGKLKIGDRIEFVTAPDTFGNGYVLPIVEITVNGEKLLSFDEGFINLNDWLAEK